MPGDEPSGVVVGDEIPQRAAKLFDGVEGVHPKEVLLQGADEAFRDAVALRLADEGRRALDAEEPYLALEVARHGVRAVVVAQGEPLGDAAADRAEVAQDALTDRLERLEAVAGRGGVAADALAGAVVDRDEDARLSLGQGDGLGHVGAPHHVHRGGGDGAVMRAPLRTADPVRREQPMLAHQAANAPGGGADAGVAQAGPDLAVALAVQARGEDLPADVPDQFGIGAGADRASARRTGRRRRQRSGRPTAPPRARRCGSDPWARSPVAVASTAAGCLIEPCRTPRQPSTVASTIESGPLGRPSGSSHTALARKLQ